MTKYLSIFSLFLLFSCNYTFACDQDINSTDCHCYYGESEDVFDPYPGTEITTGINIPYNPYPGFDFNGFDNWTIIEDAGATYDVPNIDVTSGKLWSRVTSSGERGWTDTYNFRMLAVPTTRPIGYGYEFEQWNDMTVSAKFYPKIWQNGDTTLSGIHLMSRYQTEYDLYVASLRSDGSIYIKRKWCGEYIKIASHYAKDANNLPLAIDGQLPLNKWYNLEFSIVGNVATLKINGIQQFRLSRYNLGFVDLTQPWDLNADSIEVIPSGTAGIRTDYVSTYIDDFEITN